MSLFQPTHRTHRPPVHALGPRDGIHAIHSARHGIPRPILPLLALAVALPAIALPTIALPTSAAAAEPVRAWQGGRQPVTVQHLIPSMKGGEGYGEKYTFNADFEGGGSFYFSMTISNLGFGDGMMEAKGRLTVGGQSYNWKKNLDDDEWSYDKKAFRIKAGPASISGTPDRLVMTARAEGTDVELTFTPIARAWRPRDGRVRWGDEGVNDYTVFPLMKVEGRYKPKGGDWQPLTGRGFGTQSWSNVALYETARWTLELRTIDGDKTLYLREIGATDEYGDARIPYLLVTRGDEVLLESFDYQMTPTDVMTDTRHDNRYKVPEAFTLLGRDAADPNRMVRGKVTKKKLRKRREPLKKMNAAVRAVASRYSEPVSYDYDVDVLVEVKVGEQTEQVRGVGRYEVNHLNK